MTQENKELLLRDLCARLTYHTIVSTGEEDLELVKVDILNGLVYVFSESLLEFDVFEIKPYLRPMSSMTEEEQYEYNTAIDNDIEPERIVDWYNLHHFDYRNLIERGLAIEVTEENNPYKE